MPNESTASSERTRSTYTPSPVRYLIPVMAALAGIALFVWISLPRPEVPVPHPTPTPQSAAEIQKQIDKITKQEDIPPGQKGMILGSLKANLQKAQEREKGGNVPSPSGQGTHGNGGT